MFGRPNIQKARNDVLEVLGREEGFFIRISKEAEKINQLISSGRNSGVLAEIRKHVNSESWLELREQLGAGVGKLKSRVKKVPLPLEVRKRFESLFQKMSALEGMVMVGTAEEKKEIKEKPVDWNKLSKTAKAVQEEAIGLVAYDEQVKKVFAKP